MSTESNYPTVWKIQQLDGNQAEAAQCEVTRRPLHSGIRLIAKELKTSHRNAYTGFHTPWAVRLTNESFAEIMFRAARTIVSLVEHEGIGAQSPNITSILDDSEQQLSKLLMSSDALAYLSHAGRMGYLHVVSTEAGYQAAAGCLDNAAQTNYPFPLEQL